MHEWSAAITSAHALVCVVDRVFLVWFPRTKWGAAVPDFELSILHGANSAVIRTKKPILSIVVYDEGINEGLLHDDLLQFPFQRKV